MSQTIIMSQISKNESYPKYITNIKAPNCCGTVTLILDESYTTQMVYELPSINIQIYTVVNGEYVLYKSRLLQITTDKLDTPISFILTDIPSSCVFAIIPQFDDTALESHNNTESVFDNDIWNNPTIDFPIQLIWDNSPMVCGNGGSSDGGGSGGSDTPTPVDLSEYIKYEQGVINKDKILQVNDLGYLNLTDLPDIPEQVEIEATKAVKEMPEPTNDMIGTIVQYVGETVGGYTKGYFYECIKDENNILIWNPIAVSANSGPSTVITNEARLSAPITVSMDVGNIPANTVFETGTELEEIIRALLVDYEPPYVNLSIVPDIDLYEVGDIVPSLSVIIDAKRTSLDITQIKVSVNGTVIAVLTNNVSEGGTYTLRYSKALTKTTVVYATVTDGNRVVSDSQLIQFVTPYLYGVTSDVSDVDNIPFTKLLEPQGTHTVSYTANGEYICYAYNANYDDLTSILDDNKLENIGAFTKSIVTIEGNKYKLYTSNTIVTCESFNYTFI